MIATRCRDNARSGHIRGQQGIERTPRLKATGMLEMLQLDLNRLISNHIIEHHYWCPPDIGGDTVLGRADLILPIHCNYPRYNLAKPRHDERECP